ncbi:aminopeptidase N-like [Saccoglossus kowalevskii]
MDYGDAQASHDGQVHDMMMEDGDSVPANAISELYIESDRHAPSPIDIRYKQRKGVFVSYKVAAGILVCFLVILIVVGLVVGLAGRGRPQGDGRSSAVVDNTTFATSTLDPSIPWNNIRLPPHIKPSHYELRLTPDVDVTGVFSGTVSIVVRCQKTTDVVILHALALNITGQITVRDGATNRHIDVVEDFPFPLNEFYVLRLSESLKVNNNYVITFEEFQGGLSQDLFGLYISSYETATDDGGTTKSYIMSSQFEPTFARKAFPCFDEPAMKASFSLTVIRAPWYKSLSCTKKKSTNRLPESSLYEDVYEVTPVMSTYHLAVTLSNFDYLELVRPNGHVIRAWARPQVLEHTRFALEVANWTYGYFEEYFNRNDIITKTGTSIVTVDLFAVPDHASLGMENWGLITFRESIMIVDVQTSSATSIFDIATVVAHEVAHMWFGNLVTPQWWDDLWLKEGFAMKFAYQSLDVIFPQWKVAELTLDLAVQPALELDAFMNSHAMTSPIENPKDISSYYDAVAYLKGQSIIHMLQYFVGDTAFQNAMRSYLAKYANSNADVDDLWREFSLVSTSHVPWPCHLGYLSCSMLTLNNKRNKKNHFVSFNNRSGN